MTNACYQRTRPVTNRTPPPEQPHYAVIKKDGWLCVLGLGANAILPGLGGFQLRQKRKSEEETQETPRHACPAFLANIVLIKSYHLEGAGPNTSSYKGISWTDSQLQVGFSTTGALGAGGSRLDRQTAQMGLGHVFVFYPPVSASSGSSHCIWLA